MTFWDTFFDAAVMRRYAPAILHGLGVTVGLASLVVATGLAGGLALALLRIMGIRPLNWAILFVVDVFRALPPLVIVILVYFGLPNAGFAPSPFASTWASLSLVLMAFAEEIYWAGLTAIPAGQWDAARATGLRFGQALRLVILPQALRLVVPPLTNRTIAITKGTALGSVVALSEILGEASSAMSSSYNPSPLTLGAAAYLVLFIPVVAFGRWVEARWRR